MAIIVDFADFNRAVNAGFTPNEHSVDGFAEACYNENSLGDLINAKGEIRFDAQSAEDWSLDRDEFSTAVREAIETSMYNFVANCEEIARKWGE